MLAAYNMAVCITDEGVALELLAAMKYLTVDIATMKRRTTCKYVVRRSMIYHGMKLKMSSVLCARLSSRLGRFVFTVGCGWGNITATSANFGMMMSPKSNIIVMGVGFAELEATQTFSIVSDVVVAMLMY